VTETALLSATSTMIESGDTVTLAVAAVPVLVGAMGAVWSATQEPVAKRVANTSRGNRARAAGRSDENMATLPPVDLSTGAAMPCGGAAQAKNDATPPHEAGGRANLATLPSL
jgi:hypothetical protein